MTESDPTLFETNVRIIHDRADLRITQEEACTNLFHQMAVMGSEKSGVILLLNFLHRGYTKANLYMQSVSAESYEEIHTNTTNQKYTKIVPNICETHAISDRDIVRSYFGIWKLTVVKV